MDDGGPGRAVTAPEALHAPPPPGDTAPPPPGDTAPPPPGDTAPPPPGDDAPAAPGEGPPRPGSDGMRRDATARLGAWRLLVVTLLAALVASGVTIAVARATGWGDTTTAVPGGTSSQIQPIRNDAQSILARVLPSVVAITATMQTSLPTTPFRQGTLTSMGTGVVVSRQGEIVTNDHVVRGATSVSVTLDGSAQPVGATVVGQSVSHDLALLKVNGAVDLTPATFARPSSIRVGDDVLAIGYALGLQGGPSVTEGIISATGRQVATESATGTTVHLTGMLQTDAAISSGNSGGPLVDASAKVVGINTVVATSSGTTTAENIGFAIPATTVEQLLPSLRSS